MQFRHGMHAAIVGRAWAAHPLLFCPLAVVCAVVRMLCLSVSLAACCGSRATAAASQECPAPLVAYKCSSPSCMPASVYFRRLSLRGFPILDSTYCSPKILYRYYIPGNHNDVAEKNLFYLRKAVCHCRWQPESAQNGPLTVIGIALAQNTLAVQTDHTVRMCITLCKGTMRRKKAMNKATRNTYIMDLLHQLD